jgi:hypothetical protein
MRRAARWWSIVAGAPFALATAQQLQTVELVRTPIVVSDSAARRECSAVPHRDPYVEPPRAHICRVVSFDTLSSAAGMRWSYAVQRHTSVYEFADSAGAPSRDTVVEIETVLYSAQRGKRGLSAVLHGREEEAVIRSITPAMTDRSGAALVSIQFCVNGTGGCWQEFLRYDTAGGWHRIADPLSVIQTRVRATFHGDSTHEVRPPNIDVRTLRGTAGVSASGDGNCCPSHRAEFQLALEGDRFRIVRLRVIANER